MATLIHQRCFNHAAREAVARCPDCLQFYCRECITEHDDRMVCTACLGKPAKPSFRGRGFFAFTAKLTQLVAGLALLWLFFYLLGALLLALPSSFHDGSIWQGDWLEDS